MQILAAPMHNSAQQRGAACPFSSNPLSQSRVSQRPTHARYAEASRAWPLSFSPFFPHSPPRKSTPPASLLPATSSSIATQPSPPTQRHTWSPLALASPNATNTSASPPYSLPRRRTTPPLSASSPPNPT